MLFDDSGNGDGRRGSKDDGAGRRMSRGAARAVAKCVHPLLVQTCVVLGKMAVSRVEMGEATAVAV